VSRDHRDAETRFRQGSIGEVCLFTHPRAQLSAARPRASALLPTASQARHAPRAVSPMNRVRRLRMCVDIRKRTFVPEGRNEGSQA
jgi:hypothetical protein